MNSGLLPTLRQLEYLVAVSETLNFREAAERCHVTQPALSAQIQQLEALLGVQLFERDKRHVLVTPAGEVLAARARELLGGAADLVGAAAGFHTPLSGILRLGVIPTVAPYMLPHVLPGLQRAHPGLRLLLREDRTPRLVERLERGELDVLLLALEADLGSAVTEPLFRDPFVLAAPADHPLLARELVRVADLDDEPLLLLEDGHCLRDQVLSACEGGRAEEALEFRATSLVTLVQMVAAGLGVTLLPSLALEVEVRAGAGLGVAPFAPPGPGRTLGLAWRPSSPRADELRMLGRELLPFGRGLGRPV